MVRNRQPTMKDVARSAGVAVSTVSHVINQSRYVSLETTQRVQDAIRLLGFRANRVARNLRSGKSNLVGFVVANLSSYFYIGIARGIERVLSVHGYHLTLIDSQENPEVEIENILSLHDRGIDGLILVPTNTTCGYLEPIVASGCPVVFVDRQPADFQSDSILLANSEASYKATKHLIGKGHVDIGFVAFHFGHDKIDATMQERVAGYEQAHIEAGLRIDPSHIRVAAGGAALVNELRYAESYRTMDELLQTPVSAVLCGNNHASIGVFSCLKDRLVRIPDKMAMVTFDDELWLTMATPSISVVAQPAELIGIAAAERLLQRMSGATTPYECLRLKAHLILRDSS